MASPSISAPLILSSSGVLFGLAAAAGADLSAVCVVP